MGKATVLPLLWHKIGEKPHTSMNAHMCAHKAVVVPAMDPGPGLTGPFPDLEGGDMGHGKQDTAVSLLSPSKLVQEGPKCLNRGGYRSQ